MNTLQEQEFQLGSFLRSQYLDSSSPSFINGISADVVNINQIDVRADAGGGGSVILNSVYGLLGGLFPPTPDNSIALANGTTITSPFGGYQYIPGASLSLPLSIAAYRDGTSVESVEPNLDISLNSFTSCPVNNLSSSGMPGDGSNYFLLTAGL